MRRAGHGIRFLADEPPTASECAASRDYRAARKRHSPAMVDLAKSEGVQACNPKILQIHRLDESGLMRAWERNGAGR